ncbi:fimbria/pilus outer membrane usher protein [Solimonas sp. K1W22B-7]|uniref:fimbria/pilus outer membrane usher protein n=1 Tax=Solimonas sp. K1W22B-7 TaxID=2303331 RepID=UPI0013C4A41F|nr:fimbria/pilus outer membrane usher protein [Solimonas sp. K1W22B-7]
MANPAATSCAWRLVLASLLLSLPAGGALAEAPDLVNIGLLRGPGLPASQMDLYLEVTLNGVSTQRVLHVAVTADGHHHAWIPNLRDAGIRVDGLPAEGYADLAAIPGLDYAIDTPNQRVDFIASAERLGRATQRLNAQSGKAYDARVTPGALLNYDLYGNAGDRGARSFSALTELRGFGGWGVLNSTGLSAFDDAREQEPYTRLDTTWSLSFEDRLTTLNVGDFIGGNLGWSRATRMGGVQLRRNFSLQPGLITYPLPAFFGQAALPSSVELYVNGIRQYEGEVAPGPFQLFAVPGVNGSGQAQVVLTDALGRRSAVSFPFYNSSQLLKAGLSDWSLEAGVVRRDYGFDSFRYGDAPAASGSLRYGWREWATLEAHAEASERLALGGFGGALQLGDAGVVNAAYALSEGADSGSQASLGYAWVGRRFNAGLGVTQAFDDYRDIASLEGEPPPQRSAQAVASLQFGAAGSVSVNYSRLDTELDGRQHYAGAGYSLNLQRGASLFANATRNLDDAGDTVVFAGLVWSFGSRLSLGTSFQRNRGRNLYGADLAQNSAVDGGFGWSLRTQQGEGVHDWQAEGSYRGDYGQLTAGSYSVNGLDSVYAGYSGGLVLMDRDVFASRRIDDAFVLVSTSGIADVPVYLENRPIGRTDRGGHYLLTNLNAWQPNRVAIDALGLPAQVQANAVEGEVVPTDRAGLLVDFGLREVRAAVVTLADGRGWPLPLGSRVRLDGAGVAPQMVGYDGQVYLEGLSAKNRISVITPQGASCETAFAYPPQASGIPVIGPVVCRPVLP